MQIKQTVNGVIWPAKTTWDISFLFFPNWKMMVHYVAKSVSVKSFKNTWSLLKTINRVCPGPDAFIWDWQHYLKWREKCFWLSCLKWPISLITGELIKPGDTKCVVNEGMPMYRRPFEKGRLIINFTVGRLIFIFIVFLSFFFSFFFHMLFFLYKTIDWYEPNKLCSHELLTIFRESDLHIVSPTLNICLRQSYKT